MSSSNSPTSTIDGQQLFKALLESSPTQMALLDPQFNFIQVNRAYAETDEKDPSFFPGRNHFDLYPNEENLQIFQKVVETGQVYQTQAKPFRNDRNKERGISWWDWNLVPLKNEVGDVSTLVLSLIAVTSQKNAEQALRKSESIFRRTIENANGVPYQLDQANGKYVFVGAGIEDLVGITQQKFTPHVYSKMILEQVTTDPDGLEDHVAYDIAFWRGDVVKYRADTRIQTPSGDIKWICDCAIPIHDDSGRVIGSLGILLDITDRRRANEALSESENRYRELFNSVMEGIVIADTNSIVKYCNPAYVEIFEEDSANSLIDKSILDYIPESQDEIVQSESEKREKGEGSQYELEITTAKGNKKTIFIFAKPRHDSNGNFIGSLGSVLDVTERKQADALKRIQRELAIALNAETDLKKAMMLCLDAAIDGTKMDAGGLYLFDEESGALDLVYSRGLSPKFVESVSQYSADSPSARLVMGGEPVHTSYTKLGITLSEEKKREGLRAMTVFPVKLEDRVIACLNLASHSLDEMPLPECDVIHAITAQMSQTLTRLRAQEALRASEEKFRTYVSSAPDAIFISDSQGRYVEVNEAACKLTGYSESELTSIAIPDILDPDTQSEALRSFGDLKQKGTSRLEFRLKRKDGSFIWSSLHAVALSDDRFMAFCSDITETKRFRELESRAQRLETAGQIAGQVAHDFNNLLAPLMAYPEFIREELPDGHSALKYLDDIENAAQQIADINQQLLTLGRRGHYNQEVMNLNEVVSQAVRQMEALPSTLVIETEFDDELLNIKGGSSQLFRVLSNLLINAREAMQDIGQITIRTENFYVDEMWVNYTQVPQGEYVKLTISDTGCGIPGEIKQKIFEPFFTTKIADKKRGSGLGISVVDAVIKDHDGYIDLASVMGEGTSFYLYFPVTRDSVVTPLHQEIVGGTETVLIVDDDKVQRDVCTKLLSSLGYQTTAVESGEEAVRVLHDQKYDLLILDMIMPPGIDGAETFRQTLLFNPEQKAIIVSGFAESDRVAAALKMGAGAFVKKPLTRRHIAVAVRNELDRVTRPV